MNFFDRYGNYQGTIPSAPGKIVPYIVEKTTNNNVKTTYVCYTNDALRAVQRITETTVGTTKTTVIENGFGAWEDRATLTYYPPNVAIPTTAA